jgi:hypothetical protein
MHEHRSAGPPPGVATPGTPAFEHQRRLLLELAVDAPAVGDAPADLARVLGQTPLELEAAAAGLERAGALERRGGRWFATPGVRAVEALWPLAL